MLGSWSIKVDPAFGTSSNSVQVKLNKRWQIVVLAEYWARIWPSLRYNHWIIRYPQTSVRPLFGGCDGFVDYIYGHLGLAHSLNALSGGFPLDSKVGAFINFRQRGNAASATNRDFSHVGIIVATPFMVDVNNGNDITGPTRRENFTGTGPPLGAYWGGNNPVKRSFPDPSVRGKTQLQVLDAEVGYRR